MNRLCSHISLRLKITGQTKRVLFFRRLSVLHGDALPQKRENMLVTNSGLSIWEEKLLEYHNKNNKTQIKQEAPGGTGGVKRKNMCLGIDSNLLTMPLMDA